jgi:hypothetical protein
MFARNYVQGKWHGDIRAFNSVKFAEDPRGDVYAWAVWGNYGWTGTVGYWVFDGKAWRNVDAVERLWSVVPHGPKETWLVTHDWKIALLREGRLVTGSEAQKELCSRLRFGKARFVARGSDGAAYFRLDDVTVLEPFAKVKYRALVLPPGGEAKDLGTQAGSFLDRICSRGAVLGHDGWIWGTDGSVVEGMSPDGGEFRTLEATRRLNDAWVKGCDGRGNLYVHAGGEMWRVDPEAAQPEDQGGPRLPAMRVHVVGRAWPDSLGRMWCTWAVVGSPVAVFDGKSWRTYPDASVGRERGEPRGYISAFQGANGAMVFEDDRYRFHLFDAEGWVMAKSAAGLAVDRPKRLQRALPYPPLRSESFYHHLVKDAAGRIWWAHWFHEWGVVDGKKAVDGKASGLAVGPGRKRVVSVLTPIGDGRRMLVGDEDGAAAVVMLRGDRIERVSGSPVRVDDRPPAGWRSNVLRDSTGRVWIMTRGGSQAVGPKGSRVASHAGWLTLEDRKGGLWFNERRYPSAFVVRVAPDGKEARLEVPGLLEGASMAEAKDGTVWALTLSELIRARAEGDRLAVVERFPVPVHRYDHLWCDPGGCLWHLHHDDAEPRVRYLIRYATTVAKSRPRSVE